MEEMKKIDNVIIYGDIENTEDRLGVISFNIKNKDCYEVADKFAKENDLQRITDCHREIYLTNRTKTEKLKTILRYKVN